MGQSASTPTEPPAPVVKKEITSEEVKSVKKQPACKACCACPETKKARDACIIEIGQENCAEFIEEHKICMRKMGFNI